MDHSVRRFMRDLNEASNASMERLGGQTFSASSILALTCSGVNLCINFKAWDTSSGFSSGAVALLMWICMI